MRWATSLAARREKRKADTSSAKIQLQEHTFAKLLQLCRGWHLHQRLRPQALSGGCGLTNRVRRGAELLAVPKDVRG